MTETLVAILAKFNTALVPTPFPNALYLDRIPASGTIPTYPYCVYGQILGRKMVRTFGKRDIEYPAVQFDAYSSDSAAALAAIESVAAVFDYVSLALTSGVFLACVRRRQPTVFPAGKNQSDDETYRGSIQYDTIIQKS